MTTAAFAQTRDAESLDAESLGFASERLADITSWYQAQIDAGEFPGAVVAIARNGELAYLAALGTQDRTKKIPLHAGPNSLVLWSGVLLGLNLLLLLHHRRRARLVVRGRRLMDRIGAKMFLGLLREHQPRLSHLEQPDSSAGIGDVLRSLETL